MIATFIWMLQDNLYQTTYRLKALEDNVQWTIVMGKLTI